MITTIAVADWRDLQRQVGRILSECGLIVDIEKKLGARAGDAGNEPVDVFPGAVHR